MQTTETTAPRTAPRSQESFKITPAERSDMGLVADFVRSSAHWYRPIVAEKDMAEHEVDERWASTNFEKRDFYIGRADGKAVGTISIQYFEDYAYLGYIYLDVNQVGKGYGQKLMRFAESVARAKGMAGMVLIAHPEATWAKRAYLKYGFEIIATDKKDILSWKNGILKTYHEEGFELYMYNFAKHSIAHSPKFEEVANG